MRFIVMHKVDAHMEAAGPPSQEIIQNMGKLVQESLKTGVFTNGAGLHRSALRVRVRHGGGTRTVTKGPFSGDNELIAAFFMIRAASMDAAIERADELAAIAGDGEIEIGPVVEPWDLGLIPKPAEQTSSRFLLLQKGDARTESGAPLEPKVAAALAALTKRWTDEGILLASERLARSSRGSRLGSGTKGKRTWVDGPFAESKELIAGFSLLQLPSKEDAIAWANRYAAILEGNEVDVLELEDSA